MSPGQVFVLWLVTLAVGGCLAIPFTRVLAERLRPKAAANPELEDQLDHVLTELSATRRELAELQERMDFTERVLAKQAGGERVLPPNR